MASQQDVELDPQEMSLRQHLLAAQAQAADVAAQAHEQLSGNGQQQASHNIDPAISGSAPHDAYMHMGDDGGSMSPPSADSKGGRKVLSGTKRAAQNRAAQRAFRSRKEGHIKKLEDQVQAYQILEASYQALEAQNVQLRDYIINLQSRLLETQGEYPQPPPAMAPEPETEPERHGADAVGPDGIVVLEEVQAPLDSQMYDESGLGRHADDALRQLRAPTAQMTHRGAEELQNAASQAVQVAQVPEDSSSAIEPAKGPDQQQSAEQHRSTYPDGSTK